MTHLVYGIDDKYLPPCLVSMYSALTVTSDPVKVTILTTGPDGNIRAAVGRLSDIFPNVQTEVRGFDSNHLGEYEKSDIAVRFPAASMVPLFIPWLIDGKCLFLDADTLILQDISELYRTNLRDHLIGATLAYTDAISIHKYFSFSVERIIYPSRARRRKEEHLEMANQIGFSLHEMKTKYFSSGMILMDTEAIRKSDPSRHLINGDEFHKHSRRLPDMELLNMFFKDRTLLLDLKWNVYRDRSLMSRLYTPPELWSGIAQASHRPGMLHYPQIYKRKSWKMPWYKSRRRYRLYRRICRELEENTGIPIFRMFDERL